MGYEGDEDKYHRRKHTRWISGATASKIFLSGLFCFGVYLVVSNSYGLYVRFANNYGKSYSKNLPQKNAWIYAKHVSLTSFFLVIIREKDEPSKYYYTLLPFRSFVHLIDLFSKAKIIFKDLLIVWLLMNIATLLFFPELPFESGASHSIASRISLHHIYKRTTTMGFALGA